MSRRISVVIPCFNSERYVLATLRSVLSQGWSDLEVIVVDDGSSDRSAAFVAETYPTVKLIRQKNQGVAAARNTGIRHATGDWIAFVDSDDIWLPGKLAAQWRALDKSPDARMIYGAWKVWGSIDPEPSPELINALTKEAQDGDRWVGPSGWIYTSLLEDCVVWTSTVLAHRSLFDEIGVFDSSMPIGEDYDLWLRASRVTQIIRVSKPLALYRMHNASITRRAPVENYKGRVIAHAINRWGYIGPDGKRAIRKYVRRGLARSWSDFGSANLICSEHDAARSAALKAISLSPFEATAWVVLAKSLVRRLVRGPKRRGS